MSSKENDIRRYLQEKYDADSVKKKLETYNNAANMPLFETSKHVEVKVQIRPDSRVKPALFKPDLEHPGHYLAHPQTIRAMRKDLFMGGEDFVDLEVMVQCHSCKETLDLQFWKCCPFCEADLKIN